MFETHLLRMHVNMLETIRLQAYVYIPWCRLGFDTLRLSAHKTEMDAP